MSSFSASVMGFPSLSTVILLPRVFTMVITPAYKSPYSSVEYPYAGDAPFLFDTSFSLEEARSFNMCS